MTCCFLFLVCFVSVFLFVFCCHLLYLRSFWLFFFFISFIPCSTSFYPFIVLASPIFHFSLCPFNFEVCKNIESNRRQQIRRRRPLTRHDQISMALLLFLPQCVVNIEGGRKGLLAVSLFAGCVKWVVGNETFTMDGIWKKSFWNKILKFINFYTLTVIWKLWICLINIIFIILYFFGGHLESI